MFTIKASEAHGRRLDPEYHHALRRTRIRSTYPSAKLLSLSYFRTGGTPSTAHPEYWNGSIPWVSAKDFKAFRFDDSEDHVTELALAGINAVHEWICAEDSEKGSCQALFYVRRTIQNGWGRDVLRRRRNAIRRDSVQVEERQGGRMADYTLILCGDSTGYALAKIAHHLAYPSLPDYPQHIETSRTTHGGLLNKKIQAKQKE